MYGSTTASTASAAATPASAALAYCYHCGARNPPRARWRVRIDEVERAFCCAGCLAVAQTIGSAGLAGFYAQRELATTALPAPAPPESAELKAWAQLDEVAVGAGLVRVEHEHVAETSLLLEGMTCGACVWLIEGWLAQQPGVSVATVNFATRRAHVRFDPAATRLSKLLAAVAAVGYRAHPYDPARREELARREGRTLLLRTAVALLGMMQVMMFALPTYLSMDGVEPLHRRLLDWASLTLSLPVILYSAAPFFTGALRDLRRRRLGMDVPVALALGTAFLASAAATLRTGGPVYYDSITMFVALVSLARYVELRARQRAGAAIEATAKAMPVTAERYAAWPLREALETVPASRLAVGDRVLVRPGAAIPADGTVEEGCSQVEEALLTGESVPRPRAAGDPVLAGCVNGAGALVVRVRAAGAATRLAAIARLVERAASARPRMVLLADRVAAWFTALLLLLAAGTALAWWHVDPDRAFAVTFALLVVSCPCALSLATPAALAAAAGALSRRLVVLARADALETLARATHVVFDKTGTLTFGRMRVAEVWVPERHDRDEALRTAAALEAQSEHALAQAIRVAAGARPGGPAPATDIRMVAGAGIEGRIDAAAWRIGRLPFVAGLAGDLPIEATAFLARHGSDATLVALGNAQGYAAVFACCDAVRPDAGTVIARLRARGLTPVMLSGDRAVAVQALAARLRIDLASGDLTPEDKRERVAALQRQGAIVAMIGDGVNDAPALAQAHVSLALASGTPLAQWTADVVVLGDGLRPLADAFEHARRTRTIVVQNLAWATAYNALVIPAAALGFVTPLVAAIGMSLSSLVVVLNASRAARILPAQTSAADECNDAASGISPQRELKRWKSCCC